MLLFFFFFVNKRAGRVRYNYHIYTESVQDDGMDNKTIEQACSISRFSDSAAHYSVFCSAVPDTKPKIVRNGDA